MQPPNSPQDFPNFNDPVSRAPGGSGTPGGYGASPRGPVLSFDVISEAWKIVQPNLGTYIGAILVIGLISGGLSLIQSLAAGRDANGAPQNWAVFGIFQLIMFLANQVLSSGIFRMAINHVRTGQPQFGDLFSTTDVLLHVIIAGIATSILIFLGSICCLLPGLLLSGLFMFVTPLIVDKRISAGEAISLSFNTLKPQMWMALAFIIVIGLVGVSGIIACGFGILVTAPIALLSVALAYRDFFMSGESPSQFPTYPSAPIADPSA